MDNSQVSESPPQAARDFELACFVLVNYCCAAAPSRCASAVAAGAESVARRCGMVCCTPLHVSIPRVRASARAEQRKSTRGIPKTIAGVEYAFGGGGDVHYHVRARRPLHDVLTAIRLKTTVSEIGRRALANGERHLRPLSTLQKLYPAELLERTLEVADRCQFSLKTLRYEYPE